MRNRLPESFGDRVPNLAPMVDVIMVILVFFMLGATLTLIKEGALHTELDPRSGPGEGAAVEIIPVVRISLLVQPGREGCTIEVMGRTLEPNSFARLREFLAERRAAGADPLNPAIIAPQTGVRWQDVVRAMDACTAAEFRNVQFAVEVTSPQP